MGRYVNTVGGRSWAQKPGYLPERESGPGTRPDPDLLLSSYLLTVMLPYILINYGLSSVIDLVLHTENDDLERGVSRTTRYS